MGLFSGNPKSAVQRANRARLAAYEAGTFKCTKCASSIPIQGFPALQMVPCPDCEAMNFVPLRIGRFWLFEPVGGGGMGSVYQACSATSLEDLFAVKVLPRREKERPAPVQALLNEARIANIVGHHRCLIRFVGSGNEDGEHYYAMEYVQGDRIDKLIDLQGRLPHHAVLQLALHILAAEQHIYNCGFLYRDLKPENIIIDREGYAILLDYGLCKPCEEALHPSEEFVSGSPYYLPPERLLGEGEDASSEIYSLGMVMYYAISGQTYFDASEAQALAKRHIAKLRVSAASKMRHLRPELVTLLSNMINPERAQRLQTFGEVAAAVREAMAKLPPER